MTSLTIAFARPKGWWRLWIVFTLLWVGLASVMAYDEANWSDTLDAETFSAFSRGEGTLHFQCIQSSVEAPELLKAKTARSWEKDQPVGEGSKPTQKWQDAPLVEAGPWDHYRQAEAQQYAVSCVRWGPILAGSIAAAAVPLFFLLMALAMIWVWRGFKSEASE